ncbi:SWIM zinc finger family protein [Pseudanabaena mucicola]|uniref:SWIM zinc finger domain-containing protein n=1 Tax=Pseudanabaena mucicola FACHB-723 TaxID=2692860 RepID=A0ABR8A2Q5_9CYAN|nr:SWIM zinc finger family protein [Pseudanabaena mucicola]MBD2190005.1 SWIM zinc finger domain-containing protein [Pseudanabaena mucicola FACHB-723]
MPALKISESVIRQNASDKSFQRGKEYARSQSVKDLFWRDQTLQATVAGSTYYRVSIGFSNRGIKSAECSCPYDFGGWCKHIVAVLLVGLEKPKIEERPNLAQMLEKLDLEQTRKLLHNLAAQSPDLVDLIDNQIQLLNSIKENKSKSAKASSKSQSSKTAIQHPEIDRSPFRRQLAYALSKAIRNYEYSYSDEDDPFTDTIYEEIEKTKVFLEAGDSFRAFVMLYAIAEELCNFTEEIENYLGDVENLTDHLDLAMAEAILWTDFSAKERQKWVTEIEGTQDKLCADLDFSIVALVQGWDYPYLQAVLQGKEKPENLDDQSPKISTQFKRKRSTIHKEENVYVRETNHHQLVEIRLRILQAQERFDEYLNLAKDAGIFTNYINMLLQLGRYEEAIAEAENVQDEDQAFVIAQQLLENGFEKQALYIANKGLQLQEENAKRYRTVEFADWTARLAESLGETGILLNAKIVAFKLKPSLNTYHQIRDLTKSKWKTTKDILLKYLLQFDSFAATEAKVNIFLEEGLFDEAIAIANTSYCPNQTRLRVMQAVIKNNPEWVITKAQSLAEDIIARGKSDDYEQAIACLEQVHNGYKILKQEKEWLSYRNQLVEMNARKRKLMELVKRKGL